MRRNLARRLLSSTTRGGLEEGKDGRVLSKLLGQKSSPIEQWEEELAQPMERVEGKIVAAIADLEKYRGDGPQWRRAFQAVGNIAVSTQKHLFRPQLVFLGYAAGKGETKLEAIRDSPEGLIEFAAGVELQHLFMFVHDDMMDHAMTRRGEDTIQVAITRSEREDDAFAPGRGSVHSPETVQHLTTLVGDVLQAKSMQLLAAGERKLLLSDGLKAGLIRKSALDIVLEGSFRAGAAQFDDILGWSGVERALQSPQCKGEEHLLLRLLDDKASFHSFASPLIAGIRLGSLSSDSSTTEMKQLESACSEWALRIGAAFQGLDDVMDLVLEVKDSGKDRLQDIQEGRLSLPLFLLRQKASHEEWSLVYDILGSKAVMAPSERHLLLKLISKYNLTNSALEFVDDQIELACRVLNSSPLNLPSNQLLRCGQEIYLDGVLNLSSSLRHHLS